MIWWMRIYDFCDCHLSVTKVLLSLSFALLLRALFLNHTQGMLMDGQDCTDAILAVFSTRPGITLAIMFGSRDGSQERADSDVDVAVDLGHPLAADERLVLMTALAERTSRPVDLIDLRAVGEPLLGQILRHGRKLIGSATSYADLLRRHLFDQADFLPYRRRILGERRQAWIGK